MLTFFLSRDQMVQLVQLDLLVPKVIQEMLETRDHADLKDQMYVAIV